MQILWQSALTTPLSTMSFSLIGDNRHVDKVHKKMFLKKMLAGIRDPSTQSSTSIERENSILLTRCVSLPLGQ